MTIVNRKSSNILLSLLKELNIRHTKTFTNKFFSEYPHRNNLYGLSNMLSAYQISNQGFR